MIALLLFALSLLFWRLSFSATDRLVATVRWCLAVFLLLMALVAVLASLCP